MMIYMFDGWHGENVTNPAYSTFQGSRDNMSIVIVTFKGAPQVNQEAMKKEEELDARIEAKIKGNLKVMFSIGI